MCEGVIEMFLMEFSSLESRGEGVRRECVGGVCEECVWKVEESVGGVCGGWRECEGCVGRVEGECEGCVGRVEGECGVWGEWRESV